ncbi:TPA: hypothetical protein ACXNG6_000192 [Stenotrophomonas maltophilia]
MNLEQIDTSTTAGKAEVMRLAAEGRKCFSKFKKADYVIDLIDSQSHEFDWSSFDYVVATQPAGPEEVWVLQRHGDLVCVYSEEKDGTIRYIRADLAGEEK